MTQKNEEKVDAIRFYKTRSEIIKERNPDLKYTKVKCVCCRNVTLTQNQFDYSMREHGKPLCFSCQRLDIPKRERDEYKKRMAIGYRWKKGLERYKRENKK